MQPFGENGDYRLNEPMEERRARHLQQYQRSHSPVAVDDVSDRKILHGAVLTADNDIVEQALPPEHEADISDTAHPEANRLNVFSKTFRRSTPASREALLKLLAGSKKKARITLDFGLRNMRDDLYSAVTLQRPIKPTSRLRSTWDTWILSLICYALFMIPFDIAFDVPTYPWIVFDIILDLSFMCDLYLNFLTAYRDADNELVMDFKMIRNHYLRTWFVMDLFASIPFGIISWCVPDGSVSFQIIKLMKSFRLFRMSHLYRAVAELSYLKGPLMVFVLMVLFGIAAHWFACLFWKIGVLQGIENSWIVIQGSIKDLQYADQSMQYFACLYWATVTITTLGYGDITPHTFPEICYVTFVILCGAAMYAVLISSVSMIVVGRFAAETEYNRHMDSLVAFSKLYHLPAEVHRRLKAYYDFIWERRKNFSKQSIMDDLPLELRAVVAGAIHGKMIDNNPLLANCESFGFKHMFAAKLGQIALRLPDEVLQFEGDEVREIFFVRRGLVDVVVGLDTVDELVVGKRQDGGHCGDIGLFDGGYYATSAVTVQFSEVCSISASNMMGLLNQFPRERALFIAVAKARAASIERLLTEFDELAAGKQFAASNEEDIPSNELEASNLITSAGQRFKRQSRKLITRLLGHQTTDSDFEFFWKLWETAVSPETDEMLVEHTVKMITIAPEDEKEGDQPFELNPPGDLQSSPRVHPSLNTPQDTREALSPNEVPIPTKSSSFRRPRSPGLQSFPGDRRAVDPQRPPDIKFRSILASQRSSPTTEERGGLDARGPAIRKSLVGSLDRTVGSSPRLRRISLDADEPTFHSTSIRSGQDLILAKLEEICVRLDAIESKERKGSKLEEICARLDAIESKERKGSRA